MMLSKPDPRELRVFAHVSGFEEGKEFVNYLERARARLADEADLQDGPKGDRLHGARLALKDLIDNIQHIMGKQTDF